MVSYLDTLRVESVINILILVMVIVDVDVGALDDNHKEVRHVVYETDQLVPEADRIPFESYELKHTLSVEYCVFLRFH